MDQLRDAMEALRRIEELDPRYKALADRLSSAFYEAEELGIGAARRAGERELRPGA